MCRIKYFLSLNTVALIIALRLTAQTTTVANPQKRVVLPDIEYCSWRVVDEQTGDTKRLVGGDDSDSVDIQSGEYLGCTVLGTLTVDAAKKLADIRSLHEVFLPSVDANTAETLGLLADGLDLYRLDLGSVGAGTALHDSVVRAIRNEQKLRRLGLADSVVTWEFRESLAGLASLAYLELDGVSCSFAEKLKPDMPAAFEHLAELTLARASISDTEFSLLFGKLPRLQVLKLAGCDKLTDALAETDINASGLTDLIIENCGSIAWGGIPWSTYSGLKRLVIAQCSPFPEDVEIAASVLARLENLELSDISVTDAWLSAVLAKSTRLKAILIGGISGLSGEFLHVLPPDQLAEMALKDLKSFPAQKLVALSRFKNLIDLKLVGFDNFDNNVLDAVSNLTKVRRLVLAHNPMVTKGVAEVLMTTLPLEQLDLRHCELLSKKDVKELKEKFPKVSIVWE